MTNTPQPPFPPADTVSLASIQREYLEDLKCRVSPSHYKNVKARLDRLATALQLGDLHPNCARSMWVAKPSRRQLACVTLPC